MGIVNSYVTPAGGFSGSSLTQAISATGAGNSLLVIAIVGNTPANFTSLATNLAQTPTLDFTGTNSWCRYFHLNGVTPGTTGVTLTTSAADVLALVVLEVTGPIAAPEQAAIISNGAGFGTVHTYAVAPTSAGDIVLGSVSTGNLLTAFSPTMTWPTANNVYSVNAYFGVLAAAGAQTLTVTESTGNNPPIDFVAYATASGSPTSYYLSDTVEM